MYIQRSNIEPVKSLIQNWKRSPLETQKKDDI